MVLMGRIVVHIVLTAVTSSVIKTRRVTVFVEAVAGAILVIRHVLPSVIKIRVILKQAIVTDVCLDITE